MISEDRAGTILLFSVIGDALGSPLDGLGKGHINSILKRISDYTDPMPALKAKPEKWRKPGLYSAISQLNLLFCINGKAGADPAELTAETPEVQGTGTGIFRYPDPVLTTWIDACISRSRNFIPPAVPSPQVPAACLSAALQARNEKEAFISAAGLAWKISGEPYTAAGAGIFSGMIFSTAEQEIPGDELFQAAEDISGRLVQLMKKNSGNLFALGINPDTMVLAGEKFAECFKVINQQKNGTEQQLLKILNSVLKTPATRLTVPHPLAVIPFSLFCAGTDKGRPESMFRAAMEGGSAGPLVSMTGAFAGTCSDREDLPEQLTEGLVNKKRILAAAESFGSRGAAGAAGAFTAGELSLTEKFLEELRSRTKNIKAKPESEKNLSREEQLSRHVVESWTKLDRARYKKEKQRAFRNAGENQDF